MRYIIPKTVPTGILLFILFLAYSDLHMESMRRKAPPSMSFDRLDSTNRYANWHRAGLSKPSSPRPRLLLVEVVVTKSHTLYI